MIANALPRPLTAGSVDNAILRADGTGGSALQSSGLIVDDAVIAYSVTGDAATDVITATGHIYTANQTVIFSAITGGAGLSANTVYFVRDISGSTFKVSATSGGAAINFTTNITAGSVIAIQANVAISQNTTETNSALVLTPKGTGALIAGPKPDGTATGGNARGANAVDLQIVRDTNAKVASGANSVICGGRRNRATAQDSVVCGGFNGAATGQESFVGSSQASEASGYAAGIVSGWQHQASGNFSFVGGGYQNIASGVAAVVSGGGDGSASNGNAASATASSVLGGQRALANRFAMQAHAAGQFAAQGDAQRARFVMRNKTTTNAAVELFLDGSATRLTIPSGKYLTGTINIAGIKSDGTAAASYIRQFSIKNVAGTTSLVGTVNTIGTDEASSTSISITANDTNDALKVEVTGITSETWRWVAAVDVVEVAYGS